VEYATQSPDAPLTLRVYRGANADFMLYEDEGDTYDYESGAHSVVPFHWDDVSSTLTIGLRTGSYPGMPSTRTFRIVLVREGKGFGAQTDRDVDREVVYDGSPINAALR
jgi:alpha-D-xyloside xylohydrolase